MKDLGHQAPDLCVVRLEGIQRCQVARAFFRSGRPRTPSLRESKVETSAEMLFGKNADAIPLSARLLGVFGYCGIVAMLADSAPKRSSIRRRARRSRRRMMYWCGRSGRERLTEG